MRVDYENPSDGKACHGAFVVALMIVPAAAQEARGPRSRTEIAQQAFQLALGTTQKTQNIRRHGAASRRIRQAVLGRDRTSEIGYDKLVPTSPAPARLTCARRSRSVFHRYSGSTTGR